MTRLHHEFCDGNANAEASEHLATENGIAMDKAITMVADELARFFEDIALDTRERRPSRQRHDAHPATSGTRDDASELRSSSDGLSAFCTFF